MEKMNKEIFIEETKKLGIDITEEQIEKLELFYKTSVCCNF